MPAPSSPMATRPTGSLGPPLAARIADYTVMALAIILGVGSIILFAWAGRPRLVTLGLSPVAALWWDAAISFVFFAQHSVLVRRPIRARLSEVIPARYDGACYAITSGIALALVSMLFQPGGSPMFVLTGVARLAVNAAALLAVAGFAWGAYALHGFDPLGLGPIRQHLRGSTPGTPGVAFRAKAFVVHGPYRWVRHPLYSFVIVLLWADPEITASRLVRAALWTAWIYVGALLEERDLIAEFGEVYRRYRAQVPILLPWKGRVQVQLEQSAV